MQLVNGQEERGETLGPRPNNCCSCPEDEEIEKEEKEKYKKKKEEKEKYEKKKEEKEKYEQEEKEEMYKKEKYGQEEKVVTQICILFLYEGFNAR